jgi:hypothetical protein
MICCWSSKGGSGTSVVAASLALVAAGRTHGSLLVDLCGDQPGVLGLSEPAGPGVLDWLADGVDAPPDALGRLEIDVVAGLRLLPAGSADDPHAGNQPAATGAVSANSVRRDRERHDQFTLLLTLLGVQQRHVVVDAGRVDSSSCPGVRMLAASAEVSLLVVRPCYLSLRRVAKSGIRPTAVVVVSEPWRSLTGADVADVVGAPVVAEVALEGSVARTVDAGLLATRLPRPLVRALREVG